MRGSPNPPAMGSGERLGLSAVAVVGLALVALPGCQQDAGNAGCQLTKQLVIPESPFALMPNARIDRVSSGFVIIGSDDTAVRWATLASNGVLGPTQAFPLPVGATATYFAVAGADNPVDRILVASLQPGGNGYPELRVSAVPAEGSLPPAPEAAVASVRPDAGQGSLVLGSSRSGRHAGLAWVDVETGALLLATLDGRGGLVNPPVEVDSTPAVRFGCLSFEAGKDGLSDELTLTYVRYPDDTTLAPTWAMAEASEGGVVGRRLYLGVAQPGTGMGCARGTPFAFSRESCGASDPATCSGHALVWQDSAGSWLTVYDRRSGDPQSFPFAAATDFGGPALQPPLLGVAAFGPDFGVLLALPRSVELWRLDGSGRRLPGRLVFPSLEGEIGPVSAIPTGGALTATYPDYTGTPEPTPRGRRVVADAVCY